MIGSSISHYRVTGELGRGGMGIVYRAEDTTLDRTVALKVLPPHALASADDRARFFREARAAARLNHAHIATVYEIGEAAIVPEGEDPERVAASTAADVRPFIAMEFVDGESLADRIAGGPLRLDEAVRIASQIAGALGAAHEAGIVHRDVKSGNVMLTAKGEAKVLDFGLAKTAASTQLTRQGSTLGTVAYMSPEQARGEDVDARTDLWALGVVLYEMLAGRLPFAADYEQAALYGILNEDPEPLTAVRTGVPMELEAIVAKLLRKEARLRYPSASGLLADLEALGASKPPSRRSMPAMPPASREEAVLPKRWRAYALWFGVAGILFGALVTAALMRAAGGPEGARAEAEVVRSTLMLPGDLPLDAGADRGIEVDAMDLSPDGRLLVYAARHDGGPALVLRTVADGSSRVLENTERAANPRFSPDGRWIAFIARDQLLRVPVDGGRPLYVTDVSDPTGMVWHEDGSLIVADRQGLSLVRVSPEGDRTPFGSAGSNCNCGLPDAGPGGRGIVVSGRDQERVQWFQPDGEASDLALRGQHVTFLPGGYAIYTRTGALLATRVDPASGAPIGDERLILDDLRTGSILRSAHYARSRHGTFYYVAGEPSGLTRIVVRSEDGSEREIGLPEGVYGPVSVSSDERRLLIRSYDRGGQVLELDLETGAERSVPTTGDMAGAIWHPDGRVTFVQEDVEETRVMARDPVSGQIETLFRSEVPLFLSAWSPDGRHLAYRSKWATPNELQVRDLDDGSVITLNRDDGDTYWSADFSPDGTMVSYTRVGDGGSYVYAEPFPPDGRQWLVSPQGGEEGEWLPDRNALVYRNGRDWYLVEYETTPEIRFSEPGLYFTGPYVNVAGMEYRMLSGGRALLQRPLNTEPTASRIEVIAGFDRLVEEAFQ